MRIAVCDDQQRERDSLAKNLTQYRVERNAEVSWTLFSSTVELIQAIHKGQRYDLILLDILMPGLDGMAAAKDIREIDKRVAIVFLTVSPDYALASYSVKARHYLLKPVSRDALFSLLREVESELAEEDAQMLVIDTKSGLQRIRVDRLEYCEIVGRTIYYHMANGVVLEGSGNMGELEQMLLNLPCFIKPHRSYVVNMDYIVGVNSRSFVIDMRSMKQIPIPKARRGEVRDTVRLYLDGKKVTGIG